ncbi:MAG: S-layer homology domain-containing protein [Bacillota bacterium]
MKRKKLIFSLVVLLSLCLMATAAFAAPPDWVQQKQQAKGIGVFKDLNSNHWAYDQVQTMVRSGIITGYPDKTFRPNQEVNRAEFAKMLVLSLDLDNTASGQTFKDIPKTHWAYDEIQRASNYLTGYRYADDTLYFKPGDNAVREDVAVALVKAKEIKTLTNYQEIEKYEDYHEISLNLRPYVAAAVDAKLMGGWKGRDGKMYLGPQKSLTRAEVASLLYRAVDGKFDKIVVDQDDAEKVSVDDQDNGYQGDVDFELMRIADVPAGIRDLVNDNLERETQSFTTINQKTYLVVTRGEMRTGGYDVTIRDIVDDGDMLTVYVKYTDPDPDDFVSQALTYPYVIAVIDEQDKDIRFRIER